MPAGERLGKIKGTLWFRLIGSFALIIIIGGGIIYTIVHISTRNQYERMVRESDIINARNFAPLFESYYAENGSWNGIRDYFLQSSPMMRQGNAMGGGHRMNRMMTRRMPFFTRIVLTDSSGEVIFDSAGEIEGTFHPPEHITKGEPLYFDATIIGFLFTGSMIEPALFPVDQDFLNSVNRAVLLASVIVAVLALILGTVLVLQITSPVRALSRASEQVGRGNFSVRVDTKGTDEIAHLGKNFNRMAESLARSDEARKQMIADSAHELRTPVSLIQGRIEMILEGVYEPDRNNLSALYEETQILSRLVQELQQLADADAGSLSLLKEPTLLNELAGRAGGMFEAQSREKEIEFVLQMGDQPVYAEVDGQKIYQVLTNLLSNAFRHVPRGGTVILKLQDNPPDTVMFSVENNGPSIPGDKLESIFERFFRLDPARTRKDGGKGLGLAICRAIIRAHDGSINAENIPAGGVRFTFTIPK